MTMRTSGRGGAARDFRSIVADRASATLAIAAVAVAAVAGCTTEGADPAPDPTESVTSPSASPTPEPSSSETSGADLTVPVYYATDTGTDLKLVREFRSLPDAGGPALTAGAAVLAGEPLDPDYQGLWDPAGQVLAVDLGDGVIDVDLSGAATAVTTGSQGAELAVQALVYAVTGALQSDDPVRILVDGQPVDELFGVVDTREPIARRDPLDVRLLVQINDPNEGDVVGPVVTVSGEAAAFEANVPWRVETPEGAEVQTGFTTTSEGQTFAPFSFDVTLDPGTYVVVISEDDPSGGEGRPPTSDSREITVE